MLLFENKISKTLVDIPNSTSMLIHSINGCNLKCHGCHNYEDIVNFKGTPITAKQMVKKIELNGYIFDNLIISGGEIMLNNAEHVINFIKDVKIVFKGNIVIYTNGFEYNNIKKLFNENIVDDWYVDIKFPYNMEVDDKDKELYKDILGIEYNKGDIQHVLNTINLLQKFNFRTVKYPQYNQKLYDNLLTIITSYSLRHQFNEYIDI